VEEISRAGLDGFPANPLYSPSTDDPSTRTGRFFMSRVLPASRGTEKANANVNAPGPPGVVHLSEIREVLDLYLAGLFRRAPGIRENRVWQEGKRYFFGLVRQRNRQVPARPSDSYTNLKRIYLPEKVGIFPTEEENFAFYKAIVAHKYGQIRFGSLEVLGTLEKIRDPELVLDLYGLIEDARMERHLSSEMGGIGRLFREQRRHALELRPELTGLPGRAARVEALLRITLDPPSGSAFLPGELLRWTGLYREEILRHAGNGGTPADSLNLALKIAGGLDRGDGDYSGIEPVSYRGRIHLRDVLSTLRGAIRVECVGDGEEEGDVSSDPGRTELATKRCIAPEAAEFDEEEAKRGILLNRFEKLNMIEKYFRISRPLDEDDDVEDLRKSLDELESTGVIRSARRAGSLLRVEEDFDFETEKPELDSGGATPGIPYDEWDFRIGAFRKDWCTLLERSPVHLDAAWAEALMREKGHLFNRVRREFRALRPEYRRLRKRIDGEEVDTDAYVQALADIRAGVTPSEKIYIQRARRRREIATAFLADLSASTDAYVRNLRVMDQQREALLLLGEAMEAVRDRYAIYGFSSKTRKACDVYTLKGFREEYGPEVIARIGGMKPLNYTRMGPAIRHMTRILKGEQARFRLLVILSDGKPNDFDLYEGRYGIEDIKKALLEAGGQGIRSFCITVDTEAREYLPYIFERGNFLVLDEIESLPRKLVMMYRRLTGLNSGGR